MTSIDRGSAPRAALRWGWLALLVLWGVLGPLGARRALAQELPADQAPILVAVEMNELRSAGEQSVLRALGLEVGKPLRPLRVQEAFDLYGIVVGPDRPYYESVDGGVKLVLRVSEMPRDPEVQFLGVASVSMEKVREWANLGERQRVYVDEAERVANRVQQGFKKQGFHFAEVTWAVGDPDENSVIHQIIFNVHEGPKVRCRGVEIRGNDSLPETGALFWKGGLRKLAKVETRGKSLLNWFGRVFDEDTLMADLQAMREVYRGRGWHDVKVELDGDLEFNKERNRVKVHVIVDEGPLYRVGQVSIEAFDVVEGELVASELKFSEAELLEQCQLQPGVPIELARILRDKGSLGLYYGERGYLADETFVRSGQGDGFSFLDPDMIYHEDEPVVDVVYRIVQGRPRTARRVAFQGNTHTRDHVLRREVSVLPGELVSQRELANSQRRLISLNYFADPTNPRHPLPYYRLEPVAGQPDLVDVVYIVEEGRNVDLRFTGGVDSNNGLVGIVSLAMRNFEAKDLPSGFFSTFHEIYSKEAFHGNGETFSVNISPGTEVDQWSLDYAHPDLFGTHFDNWGWQVGGSGRLRRYRSHDEERNRLRLGISHRFAQGDLSLRINGVWQRLKEDSFDSGDLPVTLTNSPPDSDFQGLSVELRYSQIDNPQLPRKGYFASLGTTVYGGPFGGDNDLIKTDLTFDYYSELFSVERAVRPGMHVGLRASVAAPYGDTDFAHYGERIFSGGSRHLRGYRFRGVGPFNGDFPLGAETFVGGTFEYRHPIYTTPIAGTSDRQEVFRWITFLDWGVPDVDAWKLDPDEIRATAGVGIGMLQPLPLAFHLGWPVAGFDTDETQVFSFSLSLR